MTRSTRMSLVLKLRPEGKCLIWIGATRGNYGVMRVGDTTRNVSRVAYAMFCGPLEDGETVKQTCGNKLCCEASHLVKGTKSKSVRLEQATNSVRVT